MDQSGSPVTSSVISTQMTYRGVAATKRLEAGDWRYSTNHSYSLQPKVYTVNGGKLYFFVSMARESSALSSNDALNHCALIPRHKKGHKGAVIGANRCY